MTGVQTCALPISPGVSDNKGKCVQLVEYLSKELKEERPYYDTFFSQKEDYVPPLTVMHPMDNNHRTLKRNADKFYMLTINPSGEEQQHLIEKAVSYTHLLMLTIHRLCSRLLLK